MADPTGGHAVPSQALPISAASAQWPVVWPVPCDTPTVWRVDLVLNEERRRRCRAFLSASEQARAGRYLREQDSDRYLASHAALRLILAAALAARPLDLTFGSNAFGKPELSGPWNGRLHFNLSHSGTVALIGLAPDARIGVDVEVLRSLPDCLAVARGHFSPDEVAALEAVPPSRRMEAFFACWTRKEAFVKALGLGLSMALDGFSVSIPPARSRLLSLDGDTGAARNWRLDHLDPAPLHVGALAIEARAGECRTLSLPPRWTDRLA